MTDPANVPEVTPSVPVPANADATKKTPPKSVSNQVPAELLSQPDVGTLIASLSEWANGLKPTKKPASFAKPVTRAIMASAISTPEQGRPILIGLSRDGTLFDLVEATAELKAAVAAGIEGTSDAIKDLSVLLGSIAIGMPAVVGYESRPIPDSKDKTLVSIIASHHHAGNTEGCMSRTVDDTFGPVAGKFVGWIALAQAELHWACASKRGRKHINGITRGITDIIVRSSNIDASMVLPLLLAISTHDAMGDRDVALTFMVQRKKLAESSVGHKLRQQLQWLFPKDVPQQTTPALSLMLAPAQQIAQPSTAVATNVALANNRIQQQLVDDLRGELESVRSDLSDRDRSLQKIRANAGELSERFEIVSEERDAVVATKEVCETEIERMRTVVQDGGKALANEVGRTQRLKSELADLRATIDDDLRRQERATRALMARRLFEKAGRIGEWLQSVEMGKADIRGLRETWDEFVVALRSEANP